MKKLLLTVLFSLIMLCSTAFAENLQVVDTTPGGTMFIDTDSVKAVVIDNEYWLAVSAEDEYTNKKFLNDFRKGTGLKDAIGTYYVYLFDNHGSKYKVVAEYIVDEQGQVLKDKGQNMTARSTEGEKTLVLLYTKALDVYQAQEQQKAAAKQAQRERMRRFVR